MNEVYKKASIKESVRKRDRKKERKRKRERESRRERGRERERARCEKREPQHLSTNPQIAVPDGYENGDIDDFSKKQLIIILLIRRRKLSVVPGNGGKWRPSLSISRAFFSLDSFLFHEPDGRTQNQKTRLSSAAKLFYERL